MTDPYVPGKIGVTIKMPESKRYAGDNPWFVFEGVDAEAIKEKIGATFGIETEGLTLSDVVVNAQSLASGLSLALGGNGGVLSNGKGSSDSPPWNEDKPAGNGDVWDQAAAARNGTPAPAADTPPADPVLSAIEGSTSVAELQQVWAENQDAFNSTPSYMDAYKAKGKALTGN